MAVAVHMLRYGGFPPNWTVWGQVTVWPGQTAVIGSGNGPFFNITGIHDGAIFQSVTGMYNGIMFPCGPDLNLTFQVDDISRTNMALLKRIPSTANSTRSRHYCRGQFFFDYGKVVGISPILEDEAQPF